MKTTNRTTAGTDLNHQDQQRSAAPPRAKRRRSVRPYFSMKLAHPFRKSGFSALLVLFGFTTLDMKAQTDRAQQSSAPAQRAEGWVMFDDQVGRELGIADDRLQQLRDVDGSYQREYMALGNDPASNPAYPALTKRRNADIQRILTPEQFERWRTTYDQPIR